ncbi:ABC transporter ATP-binding protein [Chelativorans salis]|uniref:ABC transporter ATP-binding protein n=1 Tax=Chelativorans salis TaxID=2978478 RepID=A0ABT2LQ98_9HYPH|nr:ABC transporter ATP-binding protein [Chelativorans sp. EGI FJ00035]MCT7376725.1 ABC transporter ATP-binding protein [Chelativorans sp. EGI FJ00035]
MTQAPLLSVEDLRTYCYTRAGVVKAVDGVRFALERGDSLGLVGESGSGKSMTCNSILRLLPKPAARTVGGRVLWDGRDLLTLSEREMRRVRGREIGMILQDPLISLNPVFTIANQVGEPFRLRGAAKGRSDLREKVLDVLRQVHIPSPEARLSQYPFEFSGGMRQRTVAAIALAGSPGLLIADEPTTSLDVTIQDQFLRLLRELQEKTGMALILVTHDLGIVAETCNKVAVMYAGKIVEFGDVRQVLTSPAHPYTEALLKALPVPGTRQKRLYQISGEPPNLLDPPAGCAFEPRCHRAMQACKKARPPIKRLSDGRQAACLALEAGEVR